jgi:hypothetical protein
MILITSKHRKEFGKLRVEVETIESKVYGYVCVDHLRMVDPKTRNFKLTGGEVTISCLQKCEEALKKVFAL